MTEAKPIAPPIVQPGVAFGLSDGLQADVVQGKIAAQFRENSAVILPDLLATDLRRLLKNLPEPEWVEQFIDQMQGKRLVEAQPRLMTKSLQMTFNRPEFLQWLCAISGETKLAQGDGELSEFRGAEERLPWHDDRHDKARRLALVVDLSPGKYEGGQFQLREKHSQEIKIRSGQIPYGSALLFKVRPRFEHSVAPITSGLRRVFATSFRAV